MLRSPRILLFMLLIGLGVASAPAHSTTVLASRQAGVSSLLSPLVPKLARVQTPVYLPSQLPSFHFRIYRTARVVGKYRYAVYLARDKVFSFKSLVFWMTGDRLFVETSKKRVALGHGVTGYLVSHTRRNGGLTLNFQRGTYGYSVGGMKDQDQLIQAGRSMVRVH